MIALQRLIPIILITIGVAAGMFALSKVGFAPKPFGDDDYHPTNLEIRKLSHGEGDVDKLQIRKGLLPVLFYIFPYQIAPDDSPATLYKYGIAWNFVWSVIGVYFLFLASSIMFGIRAGYVVVIFSLGIPVIFYYALGLIAEPSAFIGSALFAYGFAFYYRNSKTGHCNPVPGIAWMCTGLCILIWARLNAVGIVPMILLWGVFLYIRRKKGVSLFHYSHAFAIGIVGLLGFFSASIISNAIDQGRSQQVRDKIELEGVVMGRYEFWEEPLNWKPWEDDFRQGEVDYSNYATVRDSFFSKCMVSPADCKKTYYLWSLNMITRHPVNTIRQAGVKFVQSYLIYSSMATAGGIKEMSKKDLVLHIGLNLVNVLTFILAFAFFYSNRKDFLSLWPLYLIYISLFLFVCFFHSEQRYLFPGKPLLWLAASGWVGQWLDRRSAKQKESSSQPLI